jgi:hypothetical protein
MQREPQIAFTNGSEVRVNFGVFAGRDVTPAEIDELARRLLPDTPAISIVAEHRHEFADDVEAALHQVRVELESDTEAERLLPAVALWAHGCVAERHAEISEL